MMTRRIITDLEGQADLLRDVSCGMIETVNGQFSRIVLRPFPKWISMLDVWVWGRFCHGYRSGNRCRLYFNQPRRFSNFLSIPYIISSRGTTLQTVTAALETLDRIAKLKQSDALLCHVVNRSLSDKVMKRFGWERHCQNRFGRHFIKRFYGEYPV